MPYNKEDDNFEPQSESQPAPAIEPQDVTVPPSAAPEQVEGPPEGKNKEAAQKQYEEDAEFRAENPDLPIVRAANPEVGGEFFL